MNSSPRHPVRRQAGVTLIEMLTVMAVATVSLGSALPSFERVRQHRHLEGSAAQLQTDIQYVRSLAVAADRTLRMSFQADAAGSCYVVHAGAAGACTCNAAGTAVCSSGAEAIRSVRFPADGHVQLHANVASIVFDSAKGTSTPTGTLRLVGRDERAVHLVVNIMGRVRTCSPGRAVPGHPGC